MKSDCQMDKRQRQAWRALSLGPVWEPRRMVPADASTVMGVIEAIEVTAPSASASPPWPNLRQVVAECTGCPRSLSRSAPVFGSGQQEAVWMVVADQPDVTDDASGEPCSGVSGQLLEQMLNAIGVSRGRDVFITQAVKCRAADDRRPQHDEIAVCSGHLRHQIELLRPSLILALGSSAAHAVLSFGTPDRDLRGRVHVWQGGALQIPVVVTHDLPALLRHPQGKAQAWSDLRLARRTLDSQASSGQSA
jgi:DNA polymerase